MATLGAAHPAVSGRLTGRPDAGDGNRCSALQRTLDRGAGVARLDAVLAATYPNRGGRELPQSQSEGAGGGTVWPRRRGGAATRQHRCGWVPGVRAAHGRGGSGVHSRRRTADQPVMAGTARSLELRSDLGIPRVEERPGRRNVRACAVLLLALLVVGCGPPISVRRVPARQVSAELARSALNSDRPSLFSENVLYRWDLTRLYRRDPAAALAALHARLERGQGGSRTLFALAELCFQNAERARRQEYYFAALVYAWAFLFPESAAERSNELDPRTRIATDLYNRSLAKGFAAPDGDTVDLRSGSFALPFGQRLVVRLDEASLVWANRWLDNFVPVAELEVRGLGARFRSPGVGAPLAAAMRPLDPEAARADFVAAEMRVPVTALLRIDQPRLHVTQPVIESSLRLYHHLDVDRTEIDGRVVPLEAEPSATLAYALSRSRVWSWERWGVLRGDLISREFDRPLAFVEPYRPGRIPVVFVHGTASSPGRWADMLNVLINDRRLRDRFQYWFFFYDSGNAIPYSALRLRQTLAGAVAQLDPEGHDAALGEMVVIGHSQGGLLARLTAIHSGDRFWTSISTRPIDELYVTDKTRALLRQVFFFEPLPFVRRLVFLATPHRGSFVTERSMVHLLSRFVRLPKTLTAATADLVTGNTDALRFDPERPIFSSIYGMRPGNLVLATLDETPLAPGVAAHSIIAVRGDLPPAGQSDGVVDYESARLDWAASELVVPRSGHSVQRNPLAIEEVRRILVEHADRVCQENGVACPPPAAARAGTAPHLSSTPPTR
jgi:pimeloyl-ACP methyl ester carboxylesterase